MINFSCRCLDFSLSQFLNCSVSAFRVKELLTSFSKSVHAAQDSYNHKPSQSNLLLLQEQYNKKCNIIVIIFYAPFLLSIKFNGSFPFSLKFSQEEKFMALLKVENFVFISVGKIIFSLFIIFMNAFRLIHLLLILCRY